MVTEALAAVTEEEGLEVEGGGVSVASVTVVAAEAAMATTEEGTNATSAKLLIIEVPTRGLIRLTVTHLGWQ